MRAGEIDGLAMRMISTGIRDRARAILQNSR
jgi:hypothetical protein